MGLGEEKGKDGPYCRPSGLQKRAEFAGEFGHSPIDPTGPVCGCGQRGCWEVFASSTAALRYYAELAGKQWPK